MRFVSRTAQCVSDKNDAVSPVDGAEHGGQHADIGLAAGDDDRINMSRAQLLVKIASCPRRVCSPRCEAVSRKAMM
ncbi:hypothetical protein BJS_02318 [Bradyrhizobium japonicum SEMIA 5079]|nr:hypothetical protein BJS_02318 [Bradyrhizobium japonicum SEMIA 5079]